MTRLLLALFLFLSFSLYGETYVTLDHLVEEVLSSNPDLAATFKRIEAAEFEEKRVQIPEDPEFIVLRHTQPFKSSKPSSFKPRSRYTVLQELPFPGTLSLRGKIERQNVAFLKSEKLATMQDLILETKRLFFELYYNRRAAEINEENKKEIVKLKEMTRKLYDKDKKRFSEAVEGQVETKRLENENLKLERTKEHIVAAISTLLNTEKVDPIGEPKAEFTPPLSLNQSYLEILSSQNNPEVKAIESKIGEQNLRADLAKKECFPTFVIGSRFDHILGTNDTAWGVTVGINVPLFIPWKQKRDKQKAKALACAYQEDLSSLKSNLRGQIRKVLSTIHELDRRISLLSTETIPEIKKRLNAEAANYQTGKGLFVNLQTTIQDYYKSLLEYEQTKVEREIFLAELNRIIGNKL